MKLLFIFAALFAVANAKFSLFIDDKRIEDDYVELLNPFPYTSYKKDDSVPLEVIVQKAPRGAIENKIIELLEKARENFEVGYPDYGIPPLDPFTYDQISFKLNQPMIFKANVNIKDILVTGLKQFIIEKVKFKIIGLSLEMELLVPDITFNSAFDASGRIAVVFPFNIEGHARARMENFSIAGKATLGTTIDGYLRLRSFKMNLDVEHTSFYVSGIVGDGPIGDIMNWLLSNLTDDMIHEQMAAISETISEILFEVIGEAIKDIKLSDILG